MARKFRQLNEAFDWIRDVLKIGEISEEIIGKLKEVSDQNKYGALSFWLKPKCDDKK